MPFLFKLFEKAGGDMQQQQSKNYNKDPRHLVLLKGFALKERPLTPTANNQSIPSPMAQNTNNLSNLNSLNSLSNVNNPNNQGNNQNNDGMMANINNLNQNTGMRPGSEKIQKHAYLVNRYYETTAIHS